MISNIHDNTLREDKKLNPNIPRLYQLQNKMKQKYHI